MQSIAQVTKQNIYPVDQYCPIKGATIHENYTCMLNQTDIKKNANKFYSLQVIVDNNNYQVLTRYGRVGEKGRVSCKNFSNAAVAAIGFFCKTYRDKTGYTWQAPEIVPGPPLANKYAHMQLDAIDISETKSTIQFNSQLDPKVQSLISLISNRKMYEKTLELYDIDTNKMPLGKISHQQIDWGYTKLGQIQAAIMSSNVDQMITLSSAFWTIIPYATKRNRPPPVLDSIEKVQATVDMLDNLKQIGCAGRLIERCTNMDEIYASLQTHITTVEPMSAEWNQLATYIKNTHAPTHHYQLKLKNIYQISKQQQDAKDPNNIFATTKNHKLLIHGSRMCNFVGILTEGLRVPNNQQVSNGAMFGQGIYYADSISKSFNYCYAADSANKGLILLCEVALGNTETVYHAMDVPLRANYNSRHALGQSTPNPATAEKSVVYPEVEIPLGKLISATTGSESLLYNEYIIYRPEQYRFRYLLELDTE